MWYCGRWLPGRVRIMKSDEYVFGEEPLISNRNDFIEWVLAQELCTHSLPIVAHSKLMRESHKKTNEWSFFKGVHSLWFSFPNKRNPSVPLLLKSSPHNDAIRLHCFYIKLVILIPSLLMNWFYSCSFGRTAILSEQLWKVSLQYYVCRRPSSSQVTWCLWRHYNCLLPSALKCNVL